MYSFVLPFCRGFLRTMEQWKVGGVPFVVGWKAEMSGVEIRKRANEGREWRGNKRKQKKTKIARFHFLSNENLFLPFSFHPGVFLILCKGGRVAFEFQVCCNTYFVGYRGKVLFLL